VSSLTRPSVSAYNVSLLTAASVGTLVAMDCGPEGASVTRMTVVLVVVQMSTQLATDVIGRLAHADALKTAIRDGGGLSALVRQLQAVQPKEGTLENSSRALTVLLINNRTNQDQLR
jgi:hypothetical protein